MRNYRFRNRIQKIKRGFFIWRTLILLLINLWLDNLIFKIFQPNRDKKNKVQIKRAKWFTNQLIELGSAFIKIGQLLSSRPDLIPNTWIQELSKLQDQVPQFSYAKVEEVIKKEFDTLKEAIIEEAARMEKEMSKTNNTNTSESYKDSNLSEVLKVIEEIKEKIEQVNMNLNNKI